MKDSPFNPFLKGNGLNVAMITLTMEFRDRCSPFVLKALPFPFDVNKTIL